MGQIRKQTILSSIVIYVGFVIGFVNTYLYVKNGTFAPDQYGLTRLINDLGITFYTFASLGVTSYIYKFFPYYKDNLSEQENDQPALSLLVVTAGLLLVILSIVILKPLFVRKFSERSKLFIDYYYCIIPFTIGILYFTIFETFAWFARKSILTNFLKETGYRLFQLALILLYLFKVITFSIFIKSFASIYLVLAAILIYNLIKSGDVSFTFKKSRVTRKFLKKFLPFMGVIYSSLIINTISQYIGAIVIASVSKQGLKDVGVYTLATFIASTIIVPQRSIISATIPVLSVSWRDKNYREIYRIYWRTSINLLLIALFLFFMIWLNLQDFFTVLNINKDFEAGKTVILLLGIKAIIDAGTGVNSQIIATSNYWKFEVFTGVLLFSLAIPLNYFLVRKFGINGSAVSDLIAYTVYNVVRLVYIWKKFEMQPFTFKTVYSIVVVVVIYLICNYLFHDFNNWTGIIARSITFTILFIAAIFALKLTPDAAQLYKLAELKLRKSK